MMMDEKSQNRRQALTGVSVGALVISAISLVKSIQIVDPGSVGVRVSFGALSESTYMPGIHIVPPWVSVVTFSTKRDILEQRNSVPTQEGLNVELDLALLYHLNPKSVHEIYLSFGTDFIRRLIAPTLASVSRSITSGSAAKALYTSGRQGIQDQLRSELTKAFAPHGIVLDEVLLKSVQLPDLVRNAIEQKVQAEQDAARMEFVLAKERQEAQRKAVEAGGIADFQRIVSEGISNNLLKWKGIEATEKLASSTNAKMIFVGNSGDSLPSLLSGRDADGGA